MPAEESITSERRESLRARRMQVGNAVHRLFEQPLRPMADFYRIRFCGRDAERPYRAPIAVVGPAILQPLAVMAHEIPEPAGDGIPAMLDKRRIIRLEPSG